jgi:ketosteroid isomerase-like protein
MLSFDRCRPLVALLLLVAAARCGYAQRGVAGASCESDPVRRRVCAVDDSLGMALIRADTAALGRFYADELLSVNYRGVRSTKTMLLGAIAAGRLRFDTLQVLERGVDVRSDTAVVMEHMHQVATGTEGRHPLEVHYRRTYVRRGSLWQLVAAMIGLTPP